MKKVSNGDKVSEPVVVYNNQLQRPSNTSEWVDRSDESEKYKQWINGKLDKSIINLKSGAISVISRSQYDQILNAKFGKLGG